MISIKNYKIKGEMIEEGIRKSNGRGEFDQSTLSTSIEMLQ
jgi:hypothetical protein